METTAVVRKLKIFQDSMKFPNSINLPGLEDKTFLFLVVVVSLAFAWILWTALSATDEDHGA
jgi:hypothetical protein